MLLCLDGQRLAINYVVKRSITWLSDVCEFLNDRSQLTRSRTSIQPISTSPFRVGLIDNVSLAAQ